jgi:hypothetical protein
VIDDAQRADDPSLAVLRFAVRRLAAEPIVVLASVRSGEGRDLQQAGMDILDLAGLARDQAAALLDSRWGDRVPTDVPPACAW